mgnify:FL=1
MNKKLITGRTYFFPLPIFLDSIFGKRKEINRLVGSLKIDNNHAKEALNWTPPVSVEESIIRMVKDK